MTTAKATRIVEAKKVTWLVVMDKKPQENIQVRRK
jgi:hypothetical protein